MRLNGAEVRRRFEAARVARLATADAAGQPHVVPVTFAVDGDVVVFAVDYKPKSSTDLRRLRNIAENPQVSLLVDHYSDDWTELWWARADGSASIAGQLDREPALRLLGTKYSQYSDRPPDGIVVRIEVTRWSGWSA